MAVKGGRENGSEQLLSVANGVGAGRGKKKERLDRRLAPHAGAGMRRTQRG